MLYIYHFLSPSHAVRVTAPSSEGAEGTANHYPRKQQLILLNDFLSVQDCFHQTVALIMELQQEERRILPQ